MHSICWTDNSRLMLLFLSGIGVSMNIASTVEIIPQYLEKRKSVGYACLGLGEGIALVTLPYLLKFLLNGYGFKLTLLYISPIALLSLVGLVVFIQPKQSCDNRLKGSLLIQSYLASPKRLVSPFHLLIYITTPICKPQHRVCFEVALKMLTKEPICQWRIKLSSKTQVPPPLWITQRVRQCDIRKFCHS